MYIFSKLSLAASIIILMAFVAGTLSILDKKYTNIIMIVAAVAQLVLLLVVMTIMMTGHSKIRGVKMTRYQFSNILIKGSDHILPMYVSTTNPRKSAVFKILLEIKGITEPPEITISKIGDARITSDINDHIVRVNSFTVGDSFLFDADIIVKPGEKINFGFKKDTLVKSFFLGEFYIP
jgi:hypothetical protein